MTSALGAGLSGLIPKLRSSAKLASERGVFHLFVSIGLVQGLSLIVQFLVARALTPEDFGSVKVLDTVLGLLLVAATVGMPSAVAKFVPETKTDEARGRVLFTALCLGVAAALVVGAGTFAAAPWLPLSGPVRHYLRIVVWSLIFTALSRTIINYYQGKKEVQRMAIATVVMAVVTLSSMTLLTVIWGLQGWVAGKVVSEAIFLGALLLLVRREIVAKWQTRVGARLLAFGTWAALSLFVNRVQSTADVLYLDLWSGDAAAVGHYGVATLMMNGLALVPSAVAAAAFPYLAGRSENVRDVVALAWFILRRILMLMVPLCVAAFFIAPVLVAWTFGPAYTEAVLLFRILVPATVLGCGTLLAGSTLFAIEQAGLALAVNVVAAITGVALNYVLIPRAGAAGSAWAMDLNKLVELAMYGAVLGWVHRQTYLKGRRTIMADLEPYRKSSGWMDR